MSNVFPSLELNWNQDREDEQYGLDGGLTKRELFAAMALQGLLANPGGPIQANGSNGWSLTNCTLDQVAGAACRFADGLIAELEKPQEVA